MHLLTLILGAVILHQVSTLKCNRCIPPNPDNCEEAQCISSAYLCGALKFTSFAGDMQIGQTRMRACLSPEECVENSVNFGMTRIVISSNCCTSDLCNTQQAPEPKKADKNGKSCYHCIEKDCTSTAHCRGNEDQCISKSVDRGEGMEISKGCATSQVCDILNNPHLKSVIGGEIKCCQGDFCNSASSTSASLLLLAAPLVSLVLFT
ncbi:uncharacterized protein LOC142888258 [Nelusetta ayraudi]|uniref:uncharacterized protein LOC142888258 n=1 Tax=Nelusetta ayraudi TaxID=303726 RepID=UPI003F72D326